MTGRRRRSSLQLRMATVEVVSTTYHRRRAACTHCHDTVLVAERRVGMLLGFTVRRKPTIWFEHADPGPNGEVFDAVDDGCRRPPVAG